MTRLDEQVSAHPPAARECSQGNVRFDRIGRVPRAPVVDCGEGVAVAGIDFVQVPWPDKRAGYSLPQCGVDYVLNHLRRKGKGEQRAIYGLRRAVRFLGAPEVESLKREDFERYIDALAAEGVKASTIRAVLAPVLSSIRFAKKRERIAIVPACDLPDADYAFRRPLTEEEFRLVMKQPMSARLRRFYRVAYWTGARSRAIEELQWAWAVDFERRILNFNPPGRRITPTKRRVDGFPIPDELLALLVSWRERAADEYVIGRGPHGRCTTTYHEAAYVVRELAGLKDPTLVPRHCMRKMFATEMFDKRADPEVVGALLGDNPDMLRRHYVVIKAERMRETMLMRAAR